MGNSAQAHRVVIGLFAGRMSSSSWSSCTGAYKMSRVIPHQDSFLFSFQKLLLVVVAVVTLVHVWNKLSLPLHHHQPIQPLSQGSRVGTLCDIGESVLERTAGQVRMLLLLGNVESNPGPGAASDSIADPLGQASTLHSSGLPKPGTSRLPVRPSALSTPGTGKNNRPDQISYGMAGVFGNTGAGSAKFGYGVKSSKVSLPSIGGSKVVIGAKIWEGKMGKMELKIREKTAEVGKSNAKLNAAEEKCSQMDKMKVDLEREKASNLLYRLTFLQSDTQCHMSNAEAARMILKKKMKENEVERDTENNRKASEIASVTKEMKPVKGELKIREEARQQAEQLNKLLNNKSGIEKENFKMKVKMDDLKMQLDLISAEAEEPNQTAIKAVLENAEVDAVEVHFCSGCHILAEGERYRKDRQIGRSSDIRPQSIS